VAAYREMYGMCLVCRGGQSSAFVGNKQSLDLKMHGSTIKIGLTMFVVN
jgi:hypothetical protein